MPIGSHQTKPTKFKTVPNRGFLSQPLDTTSGLNLLGARNYDAVQGRFLTPDPLFEAGDPNQMGGYTYAGDNPSTGSDPNGLFCDGCGDEAGGAGDHVGCAQYSNGTCGTNTDEDPCTSSYSSCKSGQAAGYSTSITIDGIRVPTYEELVARINIWAGKNQSYASLVRVWITNICGSTQADDSHYTKFCHDVNKAGVLGDPDPLGLGGTWHCIKDGKNCKQALAKTGTAVANLAVTYLATRGLGKLVDSALEGEGAGAAASAEATGAIDDTESLLGKPCSFSPDTPVLLANGKSEAIGKVKIGDKVEAADPRTGKDQGGRAVQHIWINHDHDLLDVTITDGRGHTSTLHTTANHPIWDDTTHTWVRADHLKRGHKLASTKARHLFVLSIKATPGTANRWNLTVQQLHTYYVLAGTTPILVHNCNGFTPQDLQDVASHLDRVDENGERVFEDWDPNHAMISGIRDAMENGAELSEGQSNFMTHELTEKGLMDGGMDSEAAHELSLQTHPLFKNYAPEVIDQFPEEFNNNWRRAWGMAPR